MNRTRSFLDGEAQAAEFSRVLSGPDHRLDPDRLMFEFGPGIVCVTRRRIICVRHVGGAEDALPFTYKSGRFLERVETIVVEVRARRRGTNSMRKKLDQGYTFPATEAGYEEALRILSEIKEEDRKAEA